MVGTRRCWELPAYDELSWGAVLALFARSGFSLSRANQTLVEQSRRLGPDQLLSRLCTHAMPRGITRLFGSAIALTDALVHHQDIRRALAQPRTVPRSGSSPRCGSPPARGHCQPRPTSAACDWSPPTSTGATEPAPRSVAPAKPS